MCAPIKNRHLLQERRFIIVSIGLPEKIRTSDLMVRSHALYPAGLRADGFFILAHGTGIGPSEVTILLRHGAE